MGWILLCVVLLLLCQGGAGRHGCYQNPPPKTKRPGPPKGQDISSPER